MRLKELRMKKGISQDEVGKMVGHCGQTILNWENGIHDPNIKDLIILADFFDVSIDYLVERQTPNKEIEDACEQIEKIPAEELVKFIKEYLLSLKVEDK